MQFLIISIIIFSLAAISFEATDLTRKEKANGKDVCEAVVDLISKSRIFPTDHRFIIRTAYVESAFGTDPKIFEPQNGTEYYGGIWQVDLSRFLETQNTTNHPFLSTMITNIKESFELDWNSLTWRDCNQPLISGLAARLWLTTIAEPIPDTLPAQGDYWSRFYDPGSNSVNFINGAKAMEILNKCRGKMDLVIIMDGSGSIGEENFRLASTFVSDLIQTFSPENVKIGYIIYSKISKVIFPIENGLSVAEMKNLVLNQTYPQGGRTNTSGAIFTAIELFQESAQREGVTKILMVYTDGHSNDGGSVSIPALSAKNNSITTFAIGVGPKTNSEELQIIANNESYHVFQMSSYTELSESCEMMNVQTCKVPIRLAVDCRTLIVGSLGMGEKLYVCYEMAPPGLTIIIEIVSGRLKAYYSHILENPSSAFNDGTIIGRKFIPHESTSDMVCLTIESHSILTNFTIGSDMANTEVCFCTSVMGNFCGRRSKDHWYLKLCK